MSLSDRAIWHHKLPGAIAFSVIISSVIFHATCHSDCCWQPGDGDTGTKSLKTVGSEHSQPISTLIAPVDAGGVYNKLACDANEAINHKYCHVIVLRTVTTIRRALMIILWQISCATVRHKMNTLQW